MGWSFAYHDIGRKAHIESLTNKKHFSEDFTPLEHRVVGNHVWQLVRQESVGRTFITLDLIAKDRNGGWGYKGLSEDMGPYHYDCPLSLLTKASEPINETAAAWRQKVREHHAKKAAARAFNPVAGAIVKYSNGKTYELLYPAGARRGWAIKDVETGAVYRGSVSKMTPAATQTQQIA